LIINISHNAFLSQRGHCCLLWFIPHFIDGFKQQSPAQIHVPGFAVYNGYPPLRESYIYTYIFNIIDKSPLRYIQKQKAFCKLFTEGFS